MNWAIAIVGALAALIVGVVVIGWLLPQNHVASRRAHFKHPPEKVWDVIAGPLDWRPDVKRFEMLPECNGHAQWREFDQHNHSIVFERLEAVPGRLLVTRIADPKLPFGGRWTHEITKTEDGCTLTITEHGEVYNPLFRFMSRFVFGHAATMERYLKALGKKLGNEVVVEG